MTITTRPARPADDSALAAFYAATFPVEPSISAAQLQAQDVVLAQARIAGRLLTDVGQNFVPEPIWITFAKALLTHEEQ